MFQMNIAQNFKIRFQYNLVKVVDNILQYRSMIMVCLSMRFIDEKMWRIPFRHRVKK